MRRSEVAGASPDASSADRPPVDRHVRALLVGSLTGLVAYVGFEQLTLGVVASGVRSGMDPLLALLFAAASLYAVVVATLLVTFVASYLSLRLLRVPRALVVAGLATLVLAVVGCGLVWSGVGFGGVWGCALGSAAVYGVVSLLVRAPR